MAHDGIASRRGRHQINAAGTEWPRVSLGASVNAGATARSDRSARGVGLAHRELVFVARRPHVTAAELEHCRGRP